MDLREDSPSLSNSYLVEIFTSFETKVAMSLLSGSPLAGLFGFSQVRISFITSMTRNKLSVYPGIT